MTTASEIGKAIAAEIRKHGHYQGKDNANAVCLLHNPGVWVWNAGAESGAQYGEEEQAIFEQVLTSRIDANDIIEWNDNTPTEQVLEVLENL